MQVNICRNFFFSSALVMLFGAPVPLAWAAPAATTTTMASAGDPALTTQVDTPLISPAAGVVTSAQPITITDATQGATIYYQLSGALVTTTYVQYTTPIQVVPGTINVQAYATKTGDQNSNTASTTYSFLFPPAATPVLSLVPGLYSGPQTVWISDSTPGNTIYYTTNGTTPWAGSNVYSGSITVSTSEILTAIAMAPGYSTSGNASAEYDIASSSSRFTYTIAGSDTAGYSGDGGPATFAELGSYLAGVAVDSNGNVYVADNTDNVVRKVTAATGIITTIAGTGVAAHTGDNGPATSAALWSPASVAIDPTGNLFIVETGDSVVRRVDAATGNITTYAGNPTGTHSIGGPANGYLLSGIIGIAVDQYGNLYIAEPVELFEVNAASGNISEIAGYNTSSQFGYFNGVAVDHSQNVYVSDSGEQAVWKIDPLGNVFVFAGHNQGAFGGDGGPATQAVLNGPSGLAVDGLGNICISDTFDTVIREVNSSGIINTVAGIPNYYSSLGGDGSPALDVALFLPQYIAADATGNIYLADGNSRIRKITVPAAPPTSVAAAPVFSLAPGTYPDSQILAMTDDTPGAEIYVSLNGNAPTTTGQGYHGPIGITGTVTVKAIAIAPGYRASAVTSATYTITTQPASVISTIAGNGQWGFSGFGGLATNASLEGPEAVAFDGNGNLYIADWYNHVVWMVGATTGNISIVAGTGTYGNGADGGLATATQLNSPGGVAVDKSGNLYFADSGNNSIRMVTATTGIITTVAGPGVSSNLGDGGPATSAYLNQPKGIAFDGAGNLYIADTNNNRVRMIAATTGIITTVAGGGTAGEIGDGGLATAAYISWPQAVTFDHSQNLYITDSGNARIRKVDTSNGIITTIAGNGIQGNSGDGGLATAAEVDLSSESGIAVDGTGNVYFSNWPDTIRKVDAIIGGITTIAGDGYFAYGGDGGAATMAELYGPAGLALDLAGNLYIADSFNYVVRKVTLPPTAAVLLSPTPGLSTILGASNVTFQWSAVATATEYQLNLSAIAPGDSDLYTYKGAATSAIVPTLPANGVTVYARLYSFSNGTWQHNDYLYTESGTAALAVLTSPAPGVGTVLGTTNVVFQWSAGTGVTEYQLNLSAIAPGDSDLFTYKGTALTATAATLPKNGVPVYATLYSYVNGAWQSNSYLYTESGTSPGILKSPTPGVGTILGTTNVAFQWTTGAGVAVYQLNLSAVAAGQSELFSYKGTATTATAPSIPANGATVYATLYSNINGVWQSNAYEYTESGSPTPAILTSPTPGTTTILGTTSVPFQWSTGGGVSLYQLNLSAVAAGGSDLFLYKGTATTATVPSIPTNGVTVFATLYSLIKGAWQKNSYVYTESGSPTPGALTSPTPGIGTILGTSNVLFQWSAGTSATLYQLNLSAIAPGEGDLYSYKGAATSTSAPSLPANGVKVYARLYSYIDGAWLHNDYVYTEQ